MVTICLVDGNGQPVKETYMFRTLPLKGWKLPTNTLVSLRETLTGPQNYESFFWDFGKHGFVDVVVQNPSKEWDRDEVVYQIVLDDYDEALRLRYEVLRKLGYLVVESPSVSVQSLIEHFKKIPTRFGRAIEFFRIIMG